MRATHLSRATWRKSSYSNGWGGSCVEMAVLAGAAEKRDVAVRDSKDPHGTVLIVNACQWRDFTAPTKAHNLELV
jgi:hypothetical protein